MMFVLPQMLPAVGTLPCPSMTSATSLHVSPSSSEKLATVNEFGPSPPAIQLAHSRPFAVIPRPLFRAKPRRFVE